jgi:hypothetical protein
VQTVTFKDEKTMCGMRGGDQYLTATLLDGDNSCPTGYESCNGYYISEILDSYCYPVDQMDLCPITKMGWQAWSSDISYEDA